MRNQTASLIDQMKKQEEDLKKLTTHADTLAWDYYLTVREEKFHELVKSSCRVYNGKLVLSSIIGKIDLSKLDPARTPFWKSLFGKAPSSKSWEMTEKIRTDFLSYCKTQGLEVDGYWRSSDYSGGGF